MSPPTLSAIWYPVADLDRSVAFYRDVLGLPLVSRGEGHAVFRVLPQPPAFFLVRRPDLAGRGLGVDLRVGDGLATVERLLIAGGASLEDVQRGAGVRVWAVADPDGNRLDISQAL